jgi:hypothetical protein
MSSALPIEAAAEALGVSEATLRRWLAAGAPAARQGRRGRGCRTLIDPQAVQAWRATQAADSEAVEPILRDLAGRLPELIAGAVEQAFTATPSKRDPAALAWLSCATWAMTVGAVLDHIRERLPDIEEPVVTPEPIERLRKIAAR